MLNAAAEHYILASEAALIGWGLSRWESIIYVLPCDHREDASNSRVGVHKSQASH